jgi:arsenate reductase
MLSDTFAGIAPASVPAFIAAQLTGALIAIAVIKMLYPNLTPAAAADVVLPHDDHTATGNSRTDHAVHTPVRRATQA